MVTYDYYRIFYYAALFKIFSKAAEILNSNQPNIARTITRLEGELGCKLFIRSHRGVSTLSVVDTIQRLPKFCTPPCANGKTSLFIRVSPIMTS